MDIVLKSQYKETYYLAIKTIIEYNLIIEYNKGASMNYVTR